MKCSNGHSNPDTAKFCSTCGERLSEMKSCLNPECENFGKFNIPLDAEFCPDCGYNLSEIIEADSDAPFPERHPEYGLIPYCDFRYKEKFSFIFNKKPQFIEDKPRCEGKNYYFIVRGDKLGILRYEWHEHWYGDDHSNTNIIPMEYDKIEDEPPYFICFKGNTKYYFNRDGKRVQ